MDNIDQARIAISNAIAALITRRASTTDKNEKSTITTAISDLNGDMAELDQAELLKSAQAVAAASDALESCIASAKTGPFDTYLSTIENVIGQLHGTQGRLHAVDKLTPAPAANIGKVDAPIAGAGLPAINQGHVFSDLAAEYQAYFDACIPDLGKASNLKYYNERLLKNCPVYKDAGADLGVPWYFIGLIHAMESGFDFGTHLHNGDPLTARTVHVPSGRPATGSPPFSWQASARDALVYMKFDHQPDWSLPRVLYRLEGNNGFGYRSRGLPSPYLWSFSNIYKKGKYTADGTFDPNAVSAQCGAGVILRSLVNNNALKPQPDGSLV